MAILARDANQHAAGPRQRVVDRLADVILALGDALENELSLEEPQSKSRGDASLPTLTSELQHRFGCYGVKFSIGVKELGVDRSGRGAAS